MTHEKMIELIKNYINSIIKEHPIKEQGKTIQKDIYYMNGNDGTDFDWEMNYRTCEFMVFYQSEKGLGYCKVYATKDGFLKGVVWDTERYSDGVDTKPIEIGENKAREIKRLCMQYDNLNIWDKEIATLED